MLDAYIIDRIQRERESRNSIRPPLRIDVPRSERDQDERPATGGSEEESPERGIVIVDFTL